MPIDGDNAAQAEFWRSAGALWVEERRRFDDQAGAHGRAAIEALAPAVGERVIDVGCGAGSATLEIGAMVGPTGSVLGLDISPTMIDGSTAYAAERGVTNVTFAVGDATVETFDGEADGVFSRFGVMFFADPVASFRNIRTALRPDGRLSFTCWRGVDENPWVSVALGVAARYVELPFGADPTAPGPFSFADGQRVESILTDAGFREVALTRFDAPAVLGASADEAADFMTRLQPAAVALADSDPGAAEAMHAAFVAEVDAWTTSHGVSAPSASWIVTARNPR